MNIKNLAVVFIISLLAATVATAQSSGNFSASYFGQACEIVNTGCSPNTASGSCPGTLGTFTNSAAACMNNNASDKGDFCTVFEADIAVSNGSGNTLLVTPSAVTGLFTDTKVTNNVSTSTAEIGIQVCVTVDDKSAGVVGGGPDAASGVGQNCAMYDERLQSVSQNFLGAVYSLATGTQSCGIGTSTDCYLDFLMSTLSAQSYNFIVTPPGDGKQHKVKANWSLQNVTKSGIAAVGACLGPGNVTATQVKVFNNSGAITPVTF